MAQNNLMAALAYLFGWVSGLVVYFISKEDKLARFHGIQSILWNIALIVLIVIGLVIAMVAMIVLGIIGGMLNLGGITALLVIIPYGLLALFMLLLVLLTLWTMYQAFTGKMYKLPIVGGFAEKWSG